MTVSTPSAVARELGAELQQVRAATRRSQRSVAAELVCSNGLLSMWESGQRVPRADQFARLLDALGVVGDDRVRITSTWRKAAEQPAEVVVESAGHAHLDRLLDEEQAARRITTISPMVMPGLLQVSGYAREILAAEKNAGHLVAVRMGRADILRGRQPVELRALIADVALTMPVAACEVMADQLRHLLAMSSQPNITIQIVETHRRGYSGYMMGPFIILEFPSASPIVYAEQLAASSRLTGADYVRRYLAAAEEIAERAMTPARSAEVIAELVDGLEIST